MTGQLMPILMAITEDENGPVGGFDPIDDPTCITHYRYDNEYVTLASGTEVSTVDDRKGGFALTTLGGTQNLIVDSLNGKNIIQHEAGAGSGMARIIQPDVANPFGVIVYRALDPGATREILDLSQTAGQDSIFGESGALQARGTTADLLDFDTGTPWRIIMVHFNGASSKAWVNGGTNLPLGLGANTTYNALIVNTTFTQTNAGTCQTAEIIVYNALPRIEYINELGGYLGDRYGLTWNNAS